MDHLHSAFSSWNGQSVKDLPVGELNHVPEMASFPAMIGTVPEERRGHVLGRKDPQEHLGHENSEWYVQEGISILALDKAGKAIVFETIENGYTGAEGENHRIMDARTAFETQDRYRTESAGQERTIQQMVPKAGIPPIASKGPDDEAPGVEHHLRAKGHQTGR